MTVSDRKIIQPDKRGRVALNGLSDQPLAQFYEARMEGEDIVLVPMVAVPAWLVEKSGADDK